MQLVGRRELVGLRDRRDEDDLVLLCDDRDGRTLGRGQGADQEIDVLLQDQLASHAHRLVGVRLGVAHQQFELAAEHAALGVDLVHEHLGALRRGVAEEGRGPGERHRHPDLDGLLRLGDEREREQGGHEQGEDVQHERASYRESFGPGGGAAQSAANPGTRTRIRYTEVDAVM